MARQFRFESEFNSSPKRKSGCLCATLCAVGLTIVLVFFEPLIFWKTWQMLALSVCALVWRDMKRHLGFERIWKLSFWEKLRIFWKLSWDNLKRNLQLTRGTNALFLGTNLKQKEKLENLLCRLWADRADPTDKDTELSLSPHFGFSLFSLCQV